MGALLLVLLFFAYANSDATSFSIRRRELETSGHPILVRLRYFGFGMLTALAFSGTSFAPPAAQWAFWLGVAALLIGSARHYAPSPASPSPIADPGVSDRDLQNPNPLDGRRSETSSSPGAHADWPVRHRYHRLVTGVVFVAALILLVVLTISDALGFGDQCEHFFHRHDGNAFLDGFDIMRGLFFAFLPLLASYLFLRATLAFAERFLYRSAPRPGPPTR